MKTVDGDLRGKPYKVVMRKFREPPATTTKKPRTVFDIAAVMFPEGNEVGAPTDVFEGPVTVPEFFQAEVTAAISRFRRRNKTPDGIPFRVWDVVHDTDPERLTEVFNKCLGESTFPGRWKRARLALFRKPEKPEVVLILYWPLCLLDNVGKILEFLLVSRVEVHMAATGVGLSERQFGFRSGRSTNYALMFLVWHLREVTNEGRLAVIVGLDIRNAFYSIR